MLSRIAIASQKKHCERLEAISTREAASGSCVCAGFGALYARRTSADRRDFSIGVR